MVEPVSDGSNLGGFKRDELDVSDAWLSSLSADLAAKDKIDLFILVWGPGSSTSNKNFDKRMQILEHIQALSTFNHVTTSEMLDEQVPAMVEAWPNAFEREEVQARRADVIFMLLLSSHQTGVQSEVVLLGRDEALTRKAHLFMPTDWDRNDMLAQAVNNFPEHQVTRLTMNQIQECQVIRSFCEKFLADVRAQRYLRERRLQQLQ
jgi:hypothetical protein